VLETTGTDAVGSDNPTLSFNLTSVSDWGTALPFIDLMHVARPWMGHSATQWGVMDFAALTAGGYLDENGWPREIPDGMRAIGTVWDAPQPSDDRQGIFVLMYEGEGQINVNGARIISREPGRIVFENTTGGTIGLDITSTDPNHTGDYIRDVSIVAEEHLPLFEAGALFNPEWLDIISDARELRFMDWMGTNNSQISSWDDRPKADSYTWADGVPVEVMVQLANETGTDPWFNMPHLASDEYIRHFAEYVRDHLDPNLTARVEYSNEVWNWAFGQTHWLAEQARDEWGIDISQTDAWLDYHAMKATNTALIWEQVFSEAQGAAPTLVNVLGTQTANPYIAERLLNPVHWAEHDPEGYTPPAQVFEELAITSYFGYDAVTNPTFRAELLTRIAASPEAAATWLHDQLLDPSVSSSIPYEMLLWQRDADVAHKYGLDVVAYEGGQHVHHSFAVDGLTSAQIDALTDFMIDFVRSPEMADLYKVLWQAWSQVTDGPFMQFGEVGAPGRFGSWALLSELGDSTPRSEFLLEQAQNSEPWWDAIANAAYQQGVRSFGTAQGETILGTRQEDYLIGQGGDDTLIGGDANDGLNGGDGADHLLGDSGDDTLFGGTGNDTLDGGTGHDVLRGGAGDDYYFVDSPLDQVIEAADEGFDTVFTNVSIVLDPSFNIEAIRATEEAPRSELAAADGKLLAAAPLSSVTLDMTGNDFNQVLAGNSSANILNGRGGDDYLQAEGGNDTLIGGSGNDVLIGGTGNDTYFIDSALDRIIEGADEGYDTVITEVNLTLEAGLQIEEIRADSGHASVPFVLTGNEYDQVILGQAAGDRLNGGDGNDYLNGLGGVDVLDGGAGVDWMRGGEGNDYFMVDAADDRALEVAGEGFDTVFTHVDFALEAGTAIEALRGVDWSSSSSLNLTGNEFGQVLAGTSGANLLNGKAGDDYLQGFGGSDVLDGGEGADVMIGGAGDDVMFADSSWDRVIEAVGGGYDRVYTSGSLSIEAGSEVEEVRITDAAGTATATLWGNEFGQLLVGNAGKNFLRGDGGSDYLDAGDGDDEIDGGAGNDTLLGGAGRDIFELRDLGGTDHILDFVSGVDRIDLSNLDAVSRTAGNDEFTWIGSNEFSNVAGQLRAYMADGVQYLAGDVDGNGNADFLIDLGSSHLVAADVIL